MNYQTTLNSVAIDKDKDVRIEGLERQVEALKNLLKEKGVLINDGFVEDEEASEYAWDMVANDYDSFKESFKRERKEKS